MECFKLPYLTYKTQRDFSWINQEKKFVISKIICQWFSLVDIYEVLFWLKKAMITIKRKIIEKKETQAHKNLMFKGNKKLKNKPYLWHIKRRGILRYFSFKKCALSYLPIPPLGQDKTQGQFSSGV